MESKNASATYQGSIVLGVRESVKKETNVVDYISTYVTLKQSGSVYTASCPFHSDDEQSFEVDPNTQTWQCNNQYCNVGGDIFDFVMLRSGVSFEVALTYLGDHLGIRLNGLKVEEVYQQERKRLLDIVHFACDFYCHCLLLDFGQKLA